MLHLQEDLNKVRSSGVPSRGRLGWWGIGRWGRLRVRRWGRKIGNWYEGCCWLLLLNWRLTAVCPLLLWLLLRHCCCLLVLLVSELLRLLVSWLLR